MPRSGSGSRGRSPTLRTGWTASPLTDVLAMAGVLDRRRRFFVDGDVAVTGVVAVGDSWACTNPTAARGLSLGLMHAVALRDVLRETAGEPCATALRLDEVT